MIDTSGMMDIGSLSDSGVDNISELLILANKAQLFLMSHDWCKSILEGKFDRGWCYIVAVFYFVIEPTYTNVPITHWIIVGDLPSAYIDTDDNPNGACAIDGYVMEMEKWVDAVVAGESVEELIPVNVPPSMQYAIMLQGRLKTIREDILYPLRDELTCIRRRGD